MAHNKAEFEISDAQVRTVVCIDMLTGRSARVRGERDADFQSLIASSCNINQFDPPF